MKHLLSKAEEYKIEHPLSSSSIIQILWLIYSDTRGLLVQILLLSIPELKTIFMTDISKHLNESGT